MADNYGVLRCPCCGAQAMTIVERDSAPTVRIECGDCRMSTPGIVFRPASRLAGCGNVVETGWTPDLATARHQAAELWNRRVNASA